MSATEFMGAVNIDGNSNTCLQPLNLHPCEFSPRTEREAGNERFLRLHEPQARQHS